jgi:hypothetical protein
VAVGQVLGQATVVAAISGVIIVVGFLHVRYAENIADSLATSRSPLLTVLFMHQLLRNFPSLRRTDPDVESIREAGWGLIFIGVGLGVLILVALSIQAFRPAPT